MEVRISRFFRPSFFIGLMSLLIWAAYQSISPAAYHKLFWSPKTGDLLNSTLMLLVILTTVLFCYIGEKVSWRSRLSSCKPSRYEIIDLPRWWITTALGVCLLAYLVWFSIGAVRAGGFLQIYALYRADAFYVKEVILAPIPGITSFTQLGVIALPLALLNRRIGRLEKILFVAVFVMALLRSFLFSERLALLEIIIPVFIVAVTKRGLRFAQILRSFSLFVVFVMLFFIINESRRSFTARGITDFADVFLLGIYRFLGYYLTSVNNYGLALSKYDFAFPFNFTFSSLWNLPGMGNLYQILFPGRQFDAPELLAINRLNPELNVFTTIGYWVMEYSGLATLLIAALYGFASGIIYNKAKQSSYWLSFYSIWFIGILEFMRIYYLGSPRVFIPFVFFAVTLLVARRYLRSSR